MPLTIITHKQWSLIFIGIKYGFFSFLALGDELRIVVVIHDSKTVFDKGEILRKGVTVNCESIEKHHGSFDSEPGVADSVHRCVSPNVTIAGWENGFAKATC